MASNDSITPASGAPDSDLTFIYPVGNHVPNWSSGFLEAAGRQLWQKAATQTGLPWFQQAGLFCLVGVSDPAIRVEETALGFQATAVISVITPSSFSFDVRIGWRATRPGASQEDVIDLATNMEAPTDVIVDWLEPLPLDAMMPHLRPRKKRKMVVERGDFRDTIPVQEMPWSFPDIELRFHLNHVPRVAEQEQMAGACRNFSASTAYSYPTPWLVSTPVYDENNRTLTVILDTGPVSGTKADRDRLDALIRSVCQQFAHAPSLIRIL